MDELEGSQETGTSQPAGTQETGTSAETGETGGKPESLDKGTTDEPFYDPKDLPPELQQHFKRMQRSFTKKMQAAKSLEQKARMVDEFYRDPTGNLQRMASQYGYTLAQPGQNSQTGGQGKTAQEWQPKNWQDVVDKIKGEASQDAEKNILGKLSPVFNEVLTIKRGQIETVLDEAYPSWREHEDEMSALVTQHPTLANNPELLVKLVMPQEEIEGKAMQKALKKLNAKREAGKVGGGSPVKPITAKSGGKMSFNDAYEAAKKSIAG